MNTQLARHVCYATRRTIAVSITIRHASRKFKHPGRKYRKPSQTPAVNAPLKKNGANTVSIDPDHGRNIYVYHHVNTNQILYSLSPALKNRRALEQIPFTGKKSKPAALRKDHWHPLATIKFPDKAGDVERSVFQKLRECKRLHEVSWDPEIIRKEKGELVPKKERRKILDDQKPYAVAHMAAVLGKLKSGDEEGIGMKGAGKELKVDVLWSNLTDAYFASTWTQNVVHDSMKPNFNNRDPTKQRPFNKRMEEYIAMKQRIESNKPDTSEEASEERVGGRQKPRPSLLASKKMERARRHRELMESLRGKQQNYPSRGRVRNSALNMQHQEAAKEKQPEWKKTRASEKHRLLMESLKGKQQHYEPRGKGRKQGLGEKTESPAISHASGQLEPQKAVVSDKPVVSEELLVSEKPVVSEKHRLMESLKGKQQHYEPQGKGQKTENPKIGHVSSQPERKKAKVSEKHRLLMESLKGKQQKYEPRGKAEKVRATKATATST